MHTALKALILQVHRCHMPQTSEKCWTVTPT